jgi:hypothetical protein
VGAASIIGIYPWRAGGFFSRAPIYIQKPEYILGGLFPGGAFLAKNGILFLLMFLAGHERSAISTAGADASQQTCARMGRYIIF